jgi:DNA (cytosine-5)-methyltransferase 1
LSTTNGKDVIFILNVLSERPNEPVYISLGSLFDGIGAVPLAGTYFGITPVWASEILPNAVSVTKRRFPDMAHLGDITKLDGGEIKPVDIIAFGSPCQSFSIAGPRTGFAGKSGLFMEAIRVIREMREATDGEYPKIVLFENVPGLLSSGKGSYAGSDYQTALKAFCESEIPMPESGRWANAGMVRGRGFDLAWVVKDAQYHRTAQRRRRLFVVVDFAGERAGKILFESSCLSRYFAARERERQGIAPDSESGSGGKGGGIAGFSGFRSVAAGLEYAEERAPCINVTMPPNVVGAFMAGQAKNARSIAYNEAVSPTLKGSPSGLNQVPCVCEPVLARTLTARGDGSPNADGGPNIVAFAQNGRNEVRDLGDKAACLTAKPGAKQQTYVIRPHCLNPWDTQQARIHAKDGTAPTLAGADGGGGRSPAGLVMTEVPEGNTNRNRSDEAAASETDSGTPEQCPVNGNMKAFAAGNGQVDGLKLNDKAGALNCMHDRQIMVVPHPPVAGTLLASGAGLSRAAGHASETDLCVAYCLQGNMIGRKEGSGPQGDGVNEEVSFTVSSADRHAVAAPDRRNPVRPEYIVRRLTPTECERLMSLPDGYTEYGCDGKRMSDSARYQMCGNSIVVNVLAYIMQNIAARLGGDDHVRV